MFRQLPIFFLVVTAAIGCGAKPMQPPTSATITLPAVAETVSPEITSYHCDGTPYQIGNKDYCAYDVPATWRDAQRACDATAARLISFSSEENARAISLAFGSTIGISEEAYWIGLHELADDEGSWQWMDGKKLSYSHWNNGEPNDTGEEEDCAEWKLGNGSWNDAPCWATRRYICQQRPNTQLVCDGMKLHLPTGDICFSGEGTDWESAKQVCHDYGGQLLDLSTQEKDSTLHKAVGPKLGLSSIWIGYSDIAREGEWRWISGSRYEMMDHWKYGEPNNFNDEDCAQWFPEDGLVNDYSCSAKLPYVCERFDK